MTFKLLALKGVIGDLFFEVPENEISEMFLAHLNNVYGMMNVCEIFLACFVFLN